MAQELREWKQAREYLLTSLVISAEFDDKHNVGITLANLKYLWQASHDEMIPEAVAQLFGLTPEDVKKLFEGASTTTEE